ncbi:hypothetical protein J2Y63_006573 [Shinella sp. BE166]
MVASVEASKDGAAGSLEATSYELGTSLGLPQSAPHVLI